MCTLLRMRWLKNRDRRWLCPLLAVLIVVAGGCTTDAPIFDSVRDGASQGVTSVVSHLVEALVLNLFI